MTILISIDMEGVCGVTSWVQVTPPEHGGGDPVSTVEYERCRLRLTREVNAAAQGALDGGAGAVVVNDSHDGMRNLVPEELHPAVRFVSGADKPLGMVQGVDAPGVGAVLFVGYHAKAGTPGAPLAHTWNGHVNDVRFDGRSTGEFGINAAVAGHFGVPVALVAGDDKAVLQTRELLGDGVVGVAVKEGISYTSALHLHPATAQKMIREAAVRAVRQARHLEPFRLRPGCRVEVEFDHQARADGAMLTPGTTRAGDRAVAYDAADALEMHRRFRAVTRAANVHLNA